MPNSKSLLVAKRCLIITAEFFDTLKKLKTRNKEVFAKFIDDAREDRQVICDFDIPWKEERYGLPHLP